VGGQREKSAATHLTTVAAAELSATDVRAALDGVRPLAVLTDGPLRAALVAAGSDVVQRFTWAQSARRHLEVYAALDRHPASV